MATTAIQDAITSNDSVSAEILLRMYTSCASSLFTTPNEPSIAETVRYTPRVQKRERRPAGKPFVVIYLGYERNT